MYLGTSLRQVKDISPSGRLYYLIAGLLLHRRIEFARIIVIGIIPHLYRDSIRCQDRHIGMRVISVVGIITKALP